MIPEKLKEFPLLWRWTKPSHAVLPRDVLEQLTPIQPSDAEALVEIELASTPAMQHYPTTSAEADTRTWLLSQYSVETEVILVWDRESGLRLPWPIFCEYWSDFCYPSSDDIGIFTNDKKLLMQWRHYEVFEYGYGSH
tara:strand:+ start:19 stop:432 length:414 start_codon:yes stop_codon:yes gene_type:complete